MSRKGMKLHGDAYAAVRHVYDKSPGRSWRRLNSALQDTLTAAITAHLSFLPDDVAAISHDMNGAYWLGDGAGSALGERYYSLSVGCCHTPACISFERYAGRPAALWSEDNKTPQRLHVGSEFTWKAQKLTVTSMKPDHFVACSYHGRSFEGRDAICIGQFENLGDRKYRQIEGIKRKGDEVTIRFSAPVEDPYSRKVERLVRITFEELVTKRKEYEANRRLALKDIAVADTPEVLDAVSRRLASIGADAYRHFDIEDFRAAIAEREKGFGVERAEAADLKRWIAGEPLRRFFQTVRLRVWNGNVETSTGQRASVDSVRKALPIILRRRQSFGPVSNLMVDGFAVVEQNTDGVKVGCTLIPWAEVERLPKLLEVS